MSSLDKIDVEIEDELINCDNSNTLEYLEDKISYIVNTLPKTSENKIKLLAYYDAYTRECNGIEFPVDHKIQSSIVAYLGLNN